MKYSYKDKAGGFRCIYFLLQTMYTVSQVLLERENQFFRNNLTENKEKVIQFLCVTNISWMEFAQLSLSLSSHNLSMENQSHDNMYFYTVCGQVAFPAQFKNGPWCQMWMSCLILFQPSSDSWLVTFDPLVLWEVLLCRQTPDAVCLWCSFTETTTLVKWYHTLDMTQITSAEKDLMRKDII